jgi:hypothetical protein
VISGERSGCQDMVSRREEACIIIVVSVSKESEWRKIFDVIKVVVKIETYASDFPSHTRVGTHIQVSRRNLCGIDGAAIDQVLVTGNRSICIGVDEGKARYANVGFHPSRKRINCGCKSDN